MTVPEATAKFHAAATGLQKVLEKDKLARAAKPKFSTFFQKQKKITLARLERLRPLFPEPEVKTSKIKPLPSDLQNAFTGMWNEVDRDTIEDLQQIVTDTEGIGLLKGAEQLKKALPFDAKTNFNLKNPRAVKWFAQNGGDLKYIRDIQQTTSDDLQTIITQAIDEGKSYTQLEKEIRNRFDEYSEKLPGKEITRAHLIAINETGKAYEEGNMLFAQSLKDDGIRMVKTWVTSHDDKVSDGCQENEDEGPIPIDQYHTSGDQQPPRFPGCRCYEQYEQAGEEQLQKVSGLARLMNKVRVFFGDQEPPGSIPGDIWVTK
jgi:hypothetical protein